MSRRESKHVDEYLNRNFRSWPDRGMTPSSFLRKERRSDPHSVKALIDTLEQRVARDEAFTRRSMRGGVAYFPMKRLYRRGGCA